MRTAPRPTISGYNLHFMPLTNQPSNTLVPLSGTLSFLPLTNQPSDTLVSPSKTSIVGNKIPMLKEVLGSVEGEDDQQAKQLDSLLSKLSSLPALLEQVR